MAGIPRVGVGVIIMRDDEILLGRRKGSHGSGSWSFPGGHLEMYESFFDCAARETMEETGLEIDIIKELPVVTNDFFKKEDKHYVTVYIRANYIGGEAKILEPDKCYGWDWFSWDSMPDDIFIPVANLKRGGYNPFVK